MRVLMYSHDTFGLGHLRRAAALARVITAHRPGAHCAILTGSPLADAFQTPPRTQLIPLPPVIKHRNGDYAPRAQTARLDNVIAARTRCILNAVQNEPPDIVIVDKEPCGLKGEMLPALDWLHARGVPVVLGVRDVLDAPDALRAEWVRKGAVNAVNRFYDALWIYGQNAFYDPLQGLPLTEETRGKIHYLGYLPRPAAPTNIEHDPFLLVTPGGGGDGFALIDWVLSAYEATDDLPWRAHLVLGPFMPTEQRTAFLDRTACHAQVEAITFDPAIGIRMAQAAAIAGMGGHNTFCEFLTHDKPALLVPRITPRREQWIRAHRAADLGLCAVLDDPETHTTGPRDPQVMATALRALALRPRPSMTLPNGLLNGAENVAAALDDLIPPQSVARSA